MKDPQTPHKVREMNLDPSDMMRFNFFFYLLLVHANIGNSMYYKFFMDIDTYTNEKKKDIQTVLMRINDDRN
jgi:hypothetical protein